MDRWAAALQPVDSPACAVRLNRASVRSSWAKSPVFAATPTVAIDEDTIPAAPRFSIRHCPIASFVYSSRRAGPAAAVSARVVGRAGYDCGFTGGRYSGSSGDRYAICVALVTVSWTAPAVKSVVPAVP